MRGSDQDAAIGPSRQAGADQAGEEVGRGGAVVSADPGGQGCHRCMTQVQRTAVSGVRVQSTEGSLPDLVKQCSFISTGNTQMFKIHVLRAKV